MPIDAGSTPSDGDLAPFRADPLRWLAQARRERGDVFRLHTGRAVFSRLLDCREVVAVFGATAVQQVLTDTETFAMPASAAGALALPEGLAKLNRSLHSMAEPEHGQHKRALGKLLGSTAQGSNAIHVLEQTTEHWPLHEPQPLLGRMRELTLALAGHVLLSSDADPALAPLLHEYFLLRREAASPAAAADPAMREALLAAGSRVDAMLRRHLNPRETAGGVLARLRCPRAMAGLALSEDDAVGHANILFVSATEPIAVALTWMLLLLSQQPGLQRALRGDPAALDDVLLESLRLLPPNGFMVRVTTRPVKLGDLSLPAGSEVILCPLLSHRESSVFEHPDIFLPARWRGVRPTPFEYFPFGGGGHSCVGRSLGMDLLRSALGFMLQRFHTVLDADQVIDWRLHVMFMPRAEIMVRFDPPDASSVGGRWAGPVAELVDLGG